MTGNPGDGSAAREEAAVPPRAREHPVSRLEAFSDGVFAISATLLVVNLEVPDTYAELRASLNGFVAFGLSFTMLLLIWSVHNAYFRRYGLADGTTVVLNSVLLFVVMFYVYPLKFLAVALVGIYSGDRTGVEQMLVSYDEWVGLLTVYGIGFVSVFALVALMYRHAVRRRARLGLSEEQVFEARMWMRHYGLYVGVGLLSIALTQLGVGLGIGMPGWIYGALGPLCWWHAARTEKARLALVARLGKAAA
jgi:hypothetical protein